MKSRWSSLALALVSAAAAVVTPGCGYAAVAGILAADSSSGGGSGSAPLPAPRVESVSPAAASHAGGEPVTVTGSAFAADGALSVTFGGVVAEEVTVESATRLTAVVPAAALSGPVDVEVRHPATGAGSLRDGLVYTNTPPAAEVGDLGGPLSGNVVIAFALRDAEADPADVALAYSVHGGPFEPIPSGQVRSGQLTALTTAPGGVEHRVTWDSRAAFPAADARDVCLRVVPTDRLDGALGAAGESAPFDLVNDTPPTLELIQPEDDAYDVVLAYRVADSDEDPVSVVDLRWTSLSAGRSGPLAVASGQATGAVAASAEGVATRTVWESLADLGHGNNHLVTVTVAVSDGNRTVEATSEPFFVHNGPLANQAVELSLHSPRAFALADVVGADGLLDVVGAEAQGTDPARVFWLENERDGLTDPGSAVVPTLPDPAGSPFPGPDPSLQNPFLSRRGHPAVLAGLDADGDGDADVVAASRPPAAPGPFPLPLADAVEVLLAQAAADAPADYAHVVAHQATLRAAQVDGVLDVAGAAWETSQADRAAMAPAFLVPGQATAYPPAATGSAADDRFGWFATAARAAELDAPGAPGHGRPDLVLVHAIRQLGAALGGDRQGCVTIRRAGADGALGAPRYLDPTAMGALPVGAAVADVLSASRADLGFPAPVGAPDVVVANRGDDSLTFYLQHTAAAGPAPAAPTYAGVRVLLDDFAPGRARGDLVGVAAGDVDGDRAIDLVLVLARAELALVLLHDPDPAAPGSLLPASGGVVPLRLAAELSTGPQPGPPALEDLTGDGRADLVLSSTIRNEVRGWFSRGAAALGLEGPVRFTAQHRPAELAAGDLTGDGRADVVVRNAGSLDFSIYAQRPAGSLEERFRAVPTGRGAIGIGSGDVTGDGVPEVLVPLENEDEVRVYARDPRTALREAARYDLAAAAAGTGWIVSNPFVAAGADVTGDGRDDVLLGFTSAFSADGEGPYAAFGAIAGSPLGAGLARVAPSVAGFGPSSVAAGDWTGDGRPDVALAVLTGAGVTVFESVGPGGALVARRLAAPVWAGDVVVGDFDGDGRTDLAVAALVSGTSPPAGLAVYYGDGTALPAQPELYATGDLAPIGLASGDLDGDGRRDFALANYLEPEGRLLLQTRPRAFEAVDLPVGRGALDLDVGDVDGDGRDDLVVAWGAEDVLAVHLQDPDAAGPADALRGPITYPTSANPTGVTIVDVDGDGGQDVVVAARGADVLNVFLQR